MWPLAWRYQRFEFWGLACHECGSQKGWRISSCSQRLCSFVAAATCRNCGAGCFLKKYRHAGHQCEAQWEYKVLHNLESDDVIAHTFLTPRVYDICTSTCAFSMELLAGQRLDERIKKTPDKQVFDDSLRLAATWLRGLHHYPAHGELGHTHTKILSQIESASLSALNPVAHSGLELMRNSLVNLEQIPAKPVPLHGDFKASNLMLTHAGLYGIDIGLKFRNDGAMDAAQFMADLILNGQVTINKDRDVAGMVDVFMQAYGDNSRENRNLVAWWLLFFMLSWWQRELDGWKPALLVNRLYSKALADVIAFGKNLK